MQVLVESDRTVQHYRTNPPTNASPRISYESVDLADCLDHQQMCAQSTDADPHRSVNSPNHMLYSHRDSAWNRRARNKFLTNGNRTRALRLTRHSPVPLSQLFLYNIQNFKGSNPHLIPITFKSISEQTNTNKHSINSTQRTQT